MPVLIDRRLVLYLPLIAYGAVVRHAVAQTEFDDELSNAIDLLSERGLGIKRAEDIPSFFRETLDLRLQLSGGIMVEDAVSSFDNFLMSATERVRKEFPDGFGENESRDIMINSIRAQNVILSVSTVLENGFVVIRDKAIMELRSYICPLYPFC